MGFQGWGDLDSGERTDLLRRSLQDLESRLQALDDRLDEDVAALSSAVGAAEIKRQQTERELTDKIARAVSSGLGLEATGVVLFLIGVVLTTVGSIVA
jgi:hypothetical protein